MLKTMTDICPYSYTAFSMLGIGEACKRLPEMVITTPSAMVQLARARPPTNKLVLFCFLEKKLMYC